MRDRRGAYSSLTSGGSPLTFPVAARADAVDSSASMQAVDFTSVCLLCGGGGQVRWWWVMGEGVLELCVLVGWVRG